MSNTGENAELIELLRDKSEDGAFSDFERHLFLKSAQAISAADARIAEQAAEISNLDAELDHWSQLAVDDLGKNPPTSWKEIAETAHARIAELEAQGWELSGSITDLGQRLETAETLLEEARRALEPFIRLADNVFSDGKNATVADEVTLWCFNDTDITFGDLRRARATLDRIGKSSVEGKEPGAAEADQDAAKSPA